MNIIERHQSITPTKRLTCDKCGSIFEFEKSECDVTDHRGIMQDGLGRYNIKCPVGRNRQYFNW